MKNIELGEENIHDNVNILWDIIWKRHQVHPMWYQGREPKEWVETTMTQHLTQNKEDIWNRDVQKKQNGSRQFQEWKSL